MDFITHVLLLVAFYVVIRSIIKKYSNIKVVKMMDFKELRERSRMTFKAFSDHFNIPMRTLQGRVYCERKCPPYVLNLMEYKLRGKKIITE